MEQHGEAADEEHRHEQAERQQEERNKEHESDQVDDDPAAEDEREDDQGEDDFENDGAPSLRGARIMAQASRRRNGGGMSALGPVRLAVFDCDGTLVDGQHSIVAAMQEAFRAERLPEPSAGAVRRIVGLPLTDAVARLAPADEPARLAAVGRNYKEAYRRIRESGRHVEPLFPGVMETLEIFRESGFELAVATGKSRHGLAATLEYHGLSQYFTALKTSDDGPGKPNPHMLLYAMADTGADASRTVMIGDTVFDMEMARSARVAAIGVAWGYHEDAELRAAGAAAIARSFGELPGLADAALGRT